MIRYVILGAFFSSGCTLLFLPRCGDGFAQLTEECDDNNDISGDGCENDCTLTPPPEPICGDGALDTGEECDDRNTSNGDGCDSDCSIESVCGDGFTNGDELCDDGNTEGGDGCAADCSKLEACGDAFVDQGEQCDDNNQIDGDGCDSNCSFTRCKNGIETSGEVCLDAAQLLPGNLPQTIATADLNGDGLLDLVFTNFAANRVSVFLNDARGFFVPSQELLLANGPFGVALGDLDGDQEIDIVTTNIASDDISVLLNLGDGIFGGELVFPITDGPDSILLEDLDRDGQLDIAVTGFLSAQVAVIFRGDDGSFALPAETFDVQTGPRELTAGDFDNDGAIDLAVANQTSSSVSLLFGDGAGGFELDAPFLVQVNNANANPHGLVSADLNGDQNLDLVTSNTNTGSNITSVFFGDGAGGFTQENLAGAIGPISSTIGDVNGDGRLDIVTANIGNNSLSIFEQNEDTSFALSSILLVGGSPRALVLEDLDRDNHLDLAVTLSGENLVMLLPGTADGPKLAPFLGTGAAPVLATTEDLDQDDDQDLLLVNVNDAAQALLNDGQGAFNESAELATGDNAFGVAAASLNDDLFQDVLISNFGPNGAGALRLYPGLGNGLFGPELIVFQSDGLDTMVIDNFDASPSSEIAITNFTDDTVIILQRGTANNEFVVANTINNVGGSPFFIAKGNLNGDGFLDLVVGNFSTDTVTLLLGDGAGDFIPGAPLPACNEPQSISVAEITGDNIEDIVVACTNEFAILRSSGPTLREVIPVGIGPSAVAFADLNKDSLIDLIVTSEGNVANFVPGNVRVFLQEDDGFAEPILYRTAIGSQFVVTTDFNGDERPDFITTQKDANGINLFLSAP